MPRNVGERAGAGAAHLDRQQRHGCDVGEDDADEGEKGKGRRRREQPKAPACARAFMHVRAYGQAREEKRLSRNFFDHTCMQKIIMQSKPRTTLLVNDVHMFTELNLKITITSGLLDRSEL